MEIQILQMVAAEQVRKHERYVCLFQHSLQADGCSTVFFYYGLNTGDESSDEKNGRSEVKGGLTFWGTLAFIQKTLGLSNDDLMWGDSWINYRMKMADMPYTSYKSESEAKEGTIDDLKNKFGKYIQQ